MSTYSPTINIYTKLEDVFNPTKMTKEQLEDFPIECDPLSKEIKNNEKKIIFNENKGKITKQNYHSQRYVNAFISAINDTKFPLLNSKECIQKIQTEFNIVPDDTVDKTSKKKSSIMMREDMNINDANFLDLANERVKKNNKLYGIQKIRLGDLENVNDSEISKSAQEEKIQVGSNSNQEQIAEDNKEENTPLDKNPIQEKPYEMEGAYEFLEAVKFDQVKRVDDFLKVSKDYLLTFDFFKQTAFHWAAKRNNIKVLSLLIQTGKNLNSVDINHRTPLFLAVTNNNLKASQMLVTNGANPLIPDNKGRLPIDMAKDGEMRNFLFSAGDSFANTLKLSSN